MTGIDSLNCPLAGIVMVAACGFGSTPLGLFIVIVPCAPMFFSSWEQYHTKILYLGYFNGPCEGIIIACTIMSLAAIYGPQFYHQRAFDVVGWPLTDESIMMYDLFIAMCLSALFFIHLPSW
jgi:ethanolaminephosphotransferase